MNSRFTGHYLLPDRGITDDVDKLATIMETKVGTDYSVFKVPYLPYNFKEDATTQDTYRWLRMHLLSESPINSVFFGVGIGGLLAAKLQEEFPARRLSVVSINAPVSDGGITLTQGITNRVSLYSSEYSPVDWSMYAGQDYDVAWLAHGIKNCKYGLSSILMAYMQSEDLLDSVKEISHFDSLGASA